MNSRPDIDDRRRRRRNGGYPHSVLTRVVEENDGRSSHFSTLGTRCWLRARNRWHRGANRGAAIAEVTQQLPRRLLLTSRLDRFRRFLPMSWRSEGRNDLLWRSASAGKLS